MERKPVIDIMKGIAIILVIVGHLQIPDFFHHVIYSFHMPLFVIVSGYIYIYNFHIFCHRRRKFDRT